MSKNRRGGVWVAHQIVRAADQFSMVKTADGDECFVAVGDGALEISGRYQLLIGIESAFALGDRLVVAHMLKIS